MTKAPRIIGSIFLKDEIVVQSYYFNKFLPIGKLSKSIEYLNEWGVDEILILNINGKKIDLNVLENAIKICNIPICYGGGVDSIDYAKNLINIGIDKISLNSLVLTSFEKVREITNYFGSQFVTVSVNIKKYNNKYYIYDYKKKKILNDDIFSFIKRLNDIPVGEILLNFVDKDGSKAGLDIACFKKIVTSVDLPILISGGSGDFNQILNFCKKNNVVPVIGNIFNHTENPVPNLKKLFLTKYKEIRLNRFFK